MSDKREFKMPKLKDMVFADNCVPNAIINVPVVFRGEMYWLHRNEPFTPPGDRMFKTTDCDDHGFAPNDTEPYAIVQQDGVVKLASGETVLGHSDEFRFFGQRQHQFRTPC
jgi:hypothetical protein